MATVTSDIPTCDNSSLMEMRCVAAGFEDLMGWFRKIEWETQIDGLMAEREVSTTFIKAD